jgi:putative ABC transport system substrate-binding protein
MIRALTLLGMMVPLFGLMACAKSPATPSDRGAGAIHLVRIDEAGPAGEQRRRRLVERLDRAHLDYEIATVEADIGSLDDLGKALAKVPDRKGDIVLAGSALMALAATRHFHEASILFASQHDPWEGGLLSSTSPPTQPITGFTFDANTVPQILSLLERSNVTVRHVAIVADRFLAEPWTRRANAMQRQFPSYRFSVLRVDSETDLERCFREPEAAEIDAWIFLGTPIASKQFERIKTDLETRKKIAVYPRRTDVLAGGLMSYETREPDPYGIWARQIVLLSHGVPVSQVPVEHTSNFELAINLDAARRIGLSFPPKLIKSASLVVFEPLP